MERLLTAKQVAYILSCSVRTVKRRIESGQLSGSFTDNGIHKIPESSVLKYVNKLKEQAQV